MITAIYYAADQDNFSLEISEKDIFEKYADTDKLKDNIPILNYASFFGNGIDLYDTGITLGDESDYYGYIGNIEEAVLIPLSSEEELKNGLTIIFDKFSCQKVSVYLNTEPNSVLLGSVENTARLPLITHIPFSTEVAYHESISIVFSGYPENAFMTLKGIVFGKVIDFQRFFTFNSIAEVVPLGDDLPMNEINSDVLTADTFVSDEKQKIKYYDDINLLEDTVLVSLENTYPNRYTIKSRNKLQLIADGTAEYNYTGQNVADWSSRTVNAADVVESLAYNLGMGGQISYPEWFSTYKISPFLSPCSGRQILQQIAWACCCAIDTSCTDKIVFSPILDTTMPAQFLTNASNRILTTTLKKGEKYSTILWEYTKYIKNSNLVELGDVVPVFSASSGGMSEYLWSISLAEPFIFSNFKNSVNYSIDGCSPYSVSGNIAVSTTQKAMGYKYDSQKKCVSINTGLKSGKTLSITNQTIYPIDMTKKIAQLQKWYSYNNTLSATVVDKGDIRVGRPISIEQANGDIFNGIITKVERTSISDYRTVNLEVHEWH